VWGPEIISPVLPAFGPRLGNEVSYVGEFVRGLLHEYESRGRWAAALRRGGYDLLLVGRGGYSSACPVPGARSDDDAFARAEGFPKLAEGERLTLYRVRPPRAGGS
jgi:hypothetical protein